MNQIVPIGHSVRLVPVSEIAKGLRISVDDVEVLLHQLGVPVAHDMGPKRVVNLPALEWAIFRDLHPTTKGKRDTNEVIRFHQMAAAIDYSVLDRATLKRRLRRAMAKLATSTKSGKMHRER